MSLTSYRAAPPRAKTRTNGRSTRARAVSSNRRREWEGRRPHLFRRTVLRSRGEPAGPVRRAHFFCRNKKAAADATPRRPIRLRRAAPQTSAGIAVGRIETAALGQERPLLLLAKRGFAKSDRKEEKHVLGRPGSDLLFQVLRLSTIGAGEFYGRVRDGIGYRPPARTTRPAKDGSGN
jgi:hypothetical protein